MHIQELVHKLTTGQIRLRVLDLRGLEVVVTSQFFFAKWRCCLSLHICKSQDHKPYCFVKVAMVGPRWLFDHRCYIHPILFLWRWPWLDPMERTHWESSWQAWGQNWSMMRRIWSSREIVLGRLSILDLEMWQYLFWVVTFNSLINHDLETGSKKTKLYRRMEFRMADVWKRGSSTPHFFRNEQKYFVCK